MNNIHHVNLAAIDLNLLVVFDALMAERHVTKAGERLGLSQPATSNALARLRKLVDDPLFVRTAGGLQPTPRAIALAGYIQPALEQMQAALFGKDEFNPAKSERVFSLGMSDYVEFILLPKLMEKFQAIAPKASVQIRSGNRQKLLSLLDAGEIDMAIGVFSEKVVWHEEQFLFQENYVCICRSQHLQIQQSLSPEEYLAASHLLVSLNEDRVGRVDEILARRNLTRNIALSIPHFLVAPFILAQTDLIATLGERVARAFARSQNLKIFPLPFAVDGFSVFMRWHQSNQNHPAHVWLRAIVTEVSREILAENS